MQPVLLDSSFLIDLEREIESGRVGPAITWLRKERTRGQRALIVSVVSISEFLEGADDEESAHDLVDRFVAQPIGHGHAIKCADIQGKASKRGTRFGENDAWQLAVAERAGASIVGRDTNAFRALGERYEEIR